MQNTDWIIIIALGIIWGASFLFNEVLLQTLSPLMIVYLRLLGASLFLWAVVFAQSRMADFAQLSGMDIFNFVIMALLANVIPFVCITAGQQDITGGLASIINANTAFATLIIASLVPPRESLTPHRLGGVLIGLAGVIVAVGYQNIIQFSHDGMGKYLVILATITYACSAPWGKRYIGHFPPLVSATVMLSTGTVILSPYVLGVYGHELVLLNGGNIPYALMLGVVCSGVAYLLFFRVLKTAGAGNVSLATLIVPPSAIVLNAMVLGESVTPTELWGLAIITIGLVILDGRATKRIFSKN